MFAAQCKEKVHKQHEIDTPYNVNPNVRGTQRDHILPITLRLELGWFGFALGVRWFMLGVRWFALGP